ANHPRVHKHPSAPGNVGSSAGLLFALTAGVPKMSVVEPVSAGPMRSPAVGAPRDPAFHWTSGRSTPHSTILELEKGKPAGRSLSWFYKSIQGHRRATPEMCQSRCTPARRWSPDVGPQVQKILWSPGDRE